MTRRIALPISNLSVSLKLILSVSAHLLAALDYQSISTHFTILQMGM